MILGQTTLLTYVLVEWTSNTKVNSFWAHKCNFNELILLPCDKLWTHIHTPIYMYTHI